jgi:dienelactone hydrolase
VARVLQTALIVSLLSATAACHRHSVTIVPASAPGDPALTIAGNPESSAGAGWTLVGTLNGTTVNLQGVVLKPPGRGPFPAVVLSHGAGDNAASYGRALGSIMRTWGLVCIAVNYTHAGGGAPMGAPGTLLQQGASTANVFRAHAAVTVLARLRYVDLQRVAAHRHSMGAFVTTAFAAAYPDDIRVASHTAGGVLDIFRVDGMPAPTVTEARRITAPYQWHHGLLDYAVPFLLDSRFDSVLTAPHEGHLYRRLNHSQVAANPEVLSRIRAWYTAHGMF